MSAIHRNIGLASLTDTPTVSEPIREHEMLTARLRHEIVNLEVQRHDQWFSMGMDHNLVFGQDLNDFVARLKADRPSDSTIAVEFLSTEPQVMIL